MKAPIGFSLPWDYISEDETTEEAYEILDVLGPVRDGLARLKDWGISSIEFRHLHHSLELSSMARAFARVDEAGLIASIHAEDPPDSDNWTITDLLPWFPLAEDGCLVSQEEIVVALHPLTGNGKGKATVESFRLATIAMLKKLSDLRGGPCHRYHFALENQRVKGKVDPATSFDEVMEIRETSGVDKIGVCWDMGHGYANYLKNGHPRIPGKDFISAATHTHIHDLGPSGATHWPFAENTVPLDEYIGLLKEGGFNGIYNLELGFERFTSIDDRLSALTGSIRRLETLILA